MTNIKGFVEKVIFQNEQNGYVILELETTDGSIICTGHFASVSEGEFLAIQGSYVNHPTYGVQLKMEGYVSCAPEDTDSIYRYLSSGVIKGIGSVMAKKIVDEFKDEAFEVLEREPRKLARIKGISERMALEFCKQVREKRETRDIMMYLQQFGISMNLALKIYRKYGIEIYGIMKENPYRLAQDIEGIGFKMADEIAKKAGIEPDSEFRIESGIVYVLLQESGLGNTCYPVDKLKAEAIELLGISKDMDMDTYIVNLVMDKRIVVKLIGGEKMAYLPYFYYTEIQVAAKLRDLNVAYNIPEDKIVRKIESIEKKDNVSLDEQQRLAIIEAVRNGICVITGGPGTGKTTTINTLIKFFETENYEIRLAAPTGRAAKRMSETTKREAQTIHRLLEVSAANGEDTVFAKSEDEPIEADVIVVDEMSMVDISLMKSLVCAVAEGCRLVLVGDANQLPSVGPGNVLKDIIASKAFKVVQLTKIFRQDADSDIVVNAHRINNGEYVDLKKPSKDFLCVFRDVVGIFGAMTTLIKDKLSNYLSIDPMEVQVLTPTRVGQFGSVRLNELLQEQLNPPGQGKREKISGDHIFREGDKVMQVKNNYQMEWEAKTNMEGFAYECGTGVFNGDVGIISEINTFANKITVEFEYEDKLKKYVVYEGEFLSELELAYAITIHKSQGSEYPAVIIPLAAGPKRLMNRNLLYTAVTRAKHCVCMVGQGEVFYSMVENDKELERYSTLKERIEEITNENITDGN